MPEVDAQELLRLATAAAREAGGLLRTHRPRSFSTKTTPTDVVTEMDHASERLIVERLLAARPDDGVLGEEGGERAGTSGVRWVLDPIDGTVNYLYDLPYWAVCVAAEADGVVVAGVVYAPSHDELYAAVRGGGAMRNGVPIAVSAQAELAQAMVVTGFGYDARRRAVQARVLREVVPRVRDIRRFGAAALDLCTVAAGRADGFYERGLQQWDRAAAGLVATEAGAVVGGLHGSPPDERLVIAANPALFPALHDLLAPLGVDSDDSDASDA